MSNRVVPRSVARSSDCLSRPRSRSNRKRMAGGTTRSRRASRHGRRASARSTSGNSVSCRVMVPSRSKMARGGDMRGAILAQRCHDSSGLRLSCCHLVRRHCARASYRAEWNMQERFRFMPPLLGKALVIMVLVGLLLMLIGRVEQLVGERVSMRDEAAQRVAQSWGGAQTTAGVLLAIPVETTRVMVEQSAAGRETERNEIQRNVLYVLPDTLDVEAAAQPGYRTVGLYRTPVYLARVSIRG